MSRVFDITRRLNKSIQDSISGTITINIDRDSEKSIYYNNKIITLNQYNILVNRIKRDNSIVEFSINIID